MHAWDDNVVEALPLRPWRSAPTGSPPSKRVSPVSRPRGVPRPTMRDVAKAAAVSLKTVSRVVNDEGGVRPETAARVHEAIVTLGFRRNDMARVLRQGRSSGTLGLVIEDVANPFYSDITRAVERVARSRGYLVIAGSSDEDPERERDHGYAETMKDAGIGVDEQLIKRGPHDVAAAETASRELLGLSPPDRDL